MLKVFKLIFEKIYCRIDPIGFSRYLGVKVGNDCRFIGVSKATFGSEPYLISIGNHVTLTANIRFITHDGGVWVFRGEYPNMDVFGKIVIKDNVFIGLNTIIMPNSFIEDNVIVGAGSLVRGRLESNYVYAGIPVRKIMTLEDYKIKCLEKAVNTKKMSKIEKINYLKSTVK